MPPNSAHAVKQAHTRTHSHRFHYSPLGEQHGERSACTLDEQQGEREVKRHKGRSERKDGRSSKREWRDCAAEARLYDSGVLKLSLSSNETIYIRAIYPCRSSCVGRDILHLLNMMEDIYYIYILTYLDTFIVLIHKIPCHKLICFVLKWCIYYFTPCVYSDNKNTILAFLYFFGVTAKHLCSPGCRDISLVDKTSTWNASSYGSHSVSHQATVRSFVHTPITWDGQSPSNIHSLSVAPVDTLLLLKHCHP